MDTRPDPDHGLPDLRPHRDPARGRGARRPGATEGPAVVEAGGRLGSAAFTGALPGQNRLGPRPTHTSPAAFPGPHRGLRAQLP